MDKYEFNIKVEQIKKLAAKKQFKEAAQIAKDMNWHKVKDWSTLATVINVQEAVGDYLEARDMAILAYNRNLGGRKLVYKLTEILIKLKDFDNAEELYKEYEKMSQHDVNRFILLYHLKKAQKASDNELVEILEEYKEHEIDEKYMYELAKLYSRTGRRDECIKTCDDIVLWFQDGVYVEKTIKLKQDFGIELTNTQKKILEAAKNKEEDLEFTKEIQFKEQQQLARIQADEINEVFEEDELSDKKQNNTVDQKAAATMQDDSDQSNADDVNSEKDSEVQPQQVDTVKDIAVAKQDETSTDKQDQIVLDEVEEDDRFKDVSSSSIDISKGFQQEQDKEKEKKAKILSDLSDTGSLDITGRIDFAGTADTVKAPVIDFKTSVEGAKKAASGIDKASVSLKELIANAKKKIEDSCEQANREQDEFKSEVSDDSDDTTIDATEDTLDDTINFGNTSIDDDMEQSTDTSADNIQVKVPDFGLYDTQNIQAALAQSLSKIMSNDDDDTSVLRPQPIVEQSEQPQEENEEEAIDDQIEGQLSLADWMETVREEKYGKQNTREYSKAELDKMLDEKDEKSAAYEKLIAEQKQKAQAEGTEFDEEEARRKAHMQMMIHAAKTDLAIRTGKATVKLEEAVTHLKEAVNQAKEAEKPVFKTDDSMEEYTVTDEQISLETAPIHPITDEILSSVRQIMDEQDSETKQDEDTVIEDTQSETEVNGEVQEEVNNVNEDSTDENALNQDLDQTDESLNTDSTTDHTNNEMDTQIPLPTSDTTELVDDVDTADLIDEESTEKRSHRHKKFKDHDKDREIAATDVHQVEDDSKKLSPELAKIFRKYREMPGLEVQLVDFFESIKQEMMMSTSSVGNVIISGNSSSDKTDLARTLIHAINYLYPEHPKKIAKTTGESINHRGILKAMNKLKGTALIVEGAGSIQPKRINEIMNCLDQETDRMIVIFEDSDTEMNVLLNFNPELPDKFNHRIVLKQYTVNELVEMARTFARKRQYEVDDDALLELYLKIDRLHNTNDNIKLDDIKEIINRAIIKSEKRASRRFFGGLKKKRGANGDVFFLSEVDFKD